MADLSNKQFEKQWQRLLEDIQTKVTPFDRDSTESRIARKKRALVDPFFFAATYFPHYIELTEKYQKVWKDPDAKIDWIDAGFADVHPDFFALTKLDNTFKILAAFRESAKDTLIGKIDVLHKVHFELNWFTAIIAMTEIVAESKVMPLKIEIENNKRLLNDFGDLVGKVKWESSEFITSNGRKVKGYGIDQSLRGQENFGHRVDYFQLNDIEDPTRTFNNALCLQAVQSIRQDKLKSVNSQAWTGIYLCNYISKESITHELIAGKYTDHFVKRILPVLIPNPKKTKAEKAVAKQCIDAGFNDFLKSVWERRHPTVKMLKEQRDDPDTFDPEMMMRPRSKKSKKFREEDFKFFHPSTLAGKEMAFWTFIDPSAKDAGDYKAVITLGLALSSDLFEGYCMRASIQQESIDWLIATTYEHHQIFNSLVIGVEMISFASLLEREYLREMKKRGYPLPLQKIEKVDNKIAKIESLVPMVRGGLFKFCLEDTMRWNGVEYTNDQERLFQQFKGFPDPIQVSRGGVGDDGPDAFAEGVKLMQDFPHGDTFEYQTGESREAVFNNGAY